MATALQTQVASTEIGMEPNELTRDRGDEDAANRISTKLHSLLGVMNGKMLKKDRGFGILAPAEITTPIRPGDYQVDFVFDMTALEDNLRGGAKLEDLLKKGQVIPEYGETWIPPMQKTLFTGSRKGLMNQMVLVVVKDTEDLSAARSPEETIVVDTKAYKNIINGKDQLGVGVKRAQLSWYNQEKTRQMPKTIGEFYFFQVLIINDDIKMN